MRGSSRVGDPAPVSAASGDRFSPDRVISAPARVDLTPPRRGRSSSAACAADSEVRGRNRTRSTRGSSRRSRAARPTSTSRPARRPRSACAARSSSRRTPEARRRLHPRAALRHPDDRAAEALRARPPDRPHVLGVPGVARFRLNVFMEREIARRRVPCRPARAQDARGARAARVARRPDRAPARPRPRHRPDGLG